MQLDQQPASTAIREELAERLFALPDVEERPSGISVPGARALSLPAEAARGPADAFMVGREFAHLHPEPDLSLHAMLPMHLAQAATERGWAEPHPAARHGLVAPTAVMIYAPRDRDELDTVAELVTVSYLFARGELAAPDRR